MQNVLVTGGAGFIGSHVVDLALGNCERVICLDQLTYAGDLENLADARRHPKFEFIQGDIGDAKLVGQLLHDCKIDSVLNLAAETHVDNSIFGPAPFIQTNIVGTFSLLESVRGYWEQHQKFGDFRMLHVSTDEVFGALGPNDPSFCESAPYAPNSPYSASKAASDHLVKAWFRTYGLPGIVTNCSNNFGPRQHAEKLIPTVVRTALANKPIPVYGNGGNVRDWLFVKDHACALLQALKRGRIGETYCFGGDNEIDNLSLVRMICRILDSIRPRADGKSYLDSISFVTDRRGHDWRYSVDSARARSELGFACNTDFAATLEQTVRWYADTHSRPRELENAGR